MDDDNNYISTCVADEINNTIINDINLLCENIMDRIYSLQHDNDNLCENVSKCTMPIYININVNRIDGTCICVLFENIDCNMCRGDFKYNLQKHINLTINKQIHLSLNGKRIYMSTHGRGPIIDIRLKFQLFLL